jgi:hypothetical protein
MRPALTTIRQDVTAKPRGRGPPSQATPGLRRGRTSGCWSTLAGCPGCGSGSRTSGARTSDRAGPGIIQLQSCQRDGDRGHNAEDASNRRKPGRRRPPHAVSEGLPPLGDEGHLKLLLLVLPQVAAQEHAGGVVPTERAGAVHRSAPGGCPKGCPEGDLSREDQQPSRADLSRPGEHKERKDCQSPVAAKQPLHNDQRY